MTVQNSVNINSTIDFLSRDCKSKNHVNCGREWTGIGFKVICRCICHNNNNSDDSDTIHIRRNINE
jgi:hypothetical protein